LREPEEVLITIDSMGDSDPALAAHPELPAVFIFNVSALEKLQLSSKRIYFYLETLQDLAQRRELTVYLGNPYEYAKSKSVAVTYAPVPSFARFGEVAELHPYPWLKKPHGKSVRSFSAWRGKI
jgi:deoxyribodipyrimidine photo-lyase